MVNVSLKVAERLYTVIGIKNQNESINTNQTNAPIKNGSGRILPLKYKTAEIRSKIIITINITRISDCGIK